MRCVLLLCALLCAAPAAAHDYPSQSIRLIVPFAAGGAVDAVARLLSDPISKGLGKPVVIDNRAGAGGVVGMDAAAQAPADGYTVLLAHSGFTAMPGLYRKLAFDPVRDFAGVSIAGSGIYVVVVNPSVPLHSIADLIAAAKAEPGKLTYGSAGVGSTIHLAAEFFKTMAGVDILHVPYRGSGPALTDLIGGQVQIMFAPAANVLPLAKSGQLRALAVTSAKRSALAPELPALGEILPGYEAVGWYGLAVPAGTPKGAVVRLNAEANRALTSSELVEKMRLQGYEPVGGTPEGASDWIKAEVARWSKVIRDAGIQPQ
ncbi:MAG: tripartite tricarboxylate transporter substrate binding protein [Xanthobacteraceae bacterium]